MISFITVGLLLGTTCSASVFSREDLSYRGIKVDLSHRDGHAGTVLTTDKSVNRSPSFRALTDNSRESLTGYFVTASYSDVTCITAHTAVGIKLGACLKDVSSYTISTATSSSSTKSLNIRRTSYSDSSCKVQIGAPKVFTHTHGRCHHSAQYYVMPTPTFPSNVPGVLIR
jgi:hypothetical protein